MFAAVSGSTPAFGMEPMSDPAPESATKLKSFTSRASEIAIQAVALLGIRYQRGGNSPENGLDCSGLVRYVFQHAWGTALPRTAEEISKFGEHIPAEDLRPGDLVFFNTLKRGFSHVGIYLGDNRFLHAPSSGGQVRIDQMSMQYWKNRFNGARRLTAPEQK